VAPRSENESELSPDSLIQDEYSLIAFEVNERNDRTGPLVLVIPFSWRQGPKMSPDVMVLDADAQIVFETAE